MDDRSRLFEIIRDRSFRQGGRFTLVSGRTSTVYFNLKPAMLDPDGARLIGAALAGKAAALGATCISGLEMGAVPLVAAAAAMSAVAQRPLRACFIRKQAKDHGTKSLIEGLAEGEDVHVTSPRGAITIAAISDPGIPRGVAAVAMNHEGPDPRGLVERGASMTEVRVETR